MTRDGRDQDGGQGNLKLRKASRNTLMVTLERPWPVVERTTEVRRQGAELLLIHLTGKVPKGTRGKDKLIGSVEDNMLSGGRGRDVIKGQGGSDVILSAQWVASTQHQVSPTGLQRDGQISGLRGDVQAA